jgi:hypothetical protein
LPAKTNQHLVNLSFFAGLVDKNGLFIDFYSRLRHTTLPSFLQIPFIMKRAIVLIFIFLAGVSGISSQNLVIRLKDGTESIIKLSELNKCTFNSQSLKISRSDGSTIDIGLQGIGKIYFNGGSSGIGDPGTGLLAESLVIYPNPGNDKLYIRNLPVGMHPVNFYRLDGTLVLQTTLSSGNEWIDTGSLSGGLYFLRVSNQIFKYIKL